MAVSTTCMCIHSSMLLTISLNRYNYINIMLCLFKDICLDVKKSVVVPQFQEFCINLERI